MDKEWWAALIDAIVLAASLIAAELVEAELADLIVKVIVAFQPVILGWVVKTYAERKVAQVRGALEREIRSLDRKQG